MKGYPSPSFILCHTKRASHAWAQEPQQLSEWDALQTWLLLARRMSPWDELDFSFSSGCHQVHVLVFFHGVCVQGLKMNLFHMSSRLSFYCSFKLWLWLARNKTAPGHFRSLLGFSMSLISLYFQEDLLDVFLPMLLICNCQPYHTQGIFYSILCFLNVHL